MQGHLVNVTLQVMMFWLQFMVHLLWMLKMDFRCVVQMGLPFRARPKIIRVSPGPHQVMGHLLMKILLTQPTRPEMTTLPTAV